MNFKADTITAKELAEKMGLVKTTILRRAENEGWPYRSSGNRSKKFLISFLPPDIKAKVIQFQESPYQKATILPARADLDLGQAKALLNMFDSAPGWSREKAEARGEIVTAFKRFSQGLKLGEAKAQFVKRYNIGNDGLGICHETYDIIDSISRPSLDLWRSKEKALGLAGLLDSENRGKPQGKITPEMHHYIIGILTNKPHTRPVRIHEYLTNKFSGSGIPIPHQATIRRFIESWKKENESLYIFMKNPDQWRSNFQAAFGDAGVKAKYFLHMMEFDNTPADIMCADKKRYTVTAGIDIFSRKAKCLLVSTSKSTSIANLMRWLIINWGLFDVMIADNGKDYASRHIEAACGALSIDMPPLPSFTPEKKPHIERFFGSLSTMLFEELSGYIGHSVADRKEIESRKSFAQRMFTKDEVIECRMTADELQAVINTWVDKIYHQRVHSQLGKTPEQRAGESSKVVKKILDERVLDILLAPVGKPTVQSKGIRYQNGRYVAPELIDHIKKKVQIRRDLTDAGKLYVFDLESNFICIAKDAALEGLSVEEVIRAKKRQKRQIREQARALKTLAKEVGDPMAELLEAKRKDLGQVFAFSREEAFENDAIKEAAKAVVEPEPVETFVPEDGWQTADDIEKKIVALHEEPIFESGLARYKYLRRQANIRTLTDTEKGWLQGYESTEEYYQIFVMPYE